jgi:hypothetical protein
MDDILKIYLDSMVEMDGILKSSEGSSGDNDDDDNNNEGDDTTQDDSAAMSIPRRSRGKRPNYTKSVSLATLGIHEAHHYLGPAVLHYEGGYSGEKKIQIAKPFLHIKRTNADWKKLVLERIYKQETIRRLLDECFDERKGFGNPLGVLHVYQTKDEMISDVHTNKPLSGVLLDEKLWLAYRPHFHVDESDEWVCGESVPVGIAIRSSVNLQRVTFDDTVGEMVLEACWCAPMELAVDNATRSFTSLATMDKVVQQYTLFLPLMDRSEQYINSYFVVGHKWTERTANGNFLHSPIEEEVFKDWLHQANIDN